MLALLTDNASRKALKDDAYGLTTIIAACLLVSYMPPARLAARSSPNAPRAARMAQ